MGDNMILFAVTVFVNIKSASYASYLWRKGDVLPSLGVWLITAASVILSAVQWQM